MFPEEKINIGRTENIFYLFFSLRQYITQQVSFLSAFRVKIDVILFYLITLGTTIDYLSFYFTSYL